MSWFPYPRETDDVALLVPTGTWTAERVVELFSDPSGEEWRHKVGVVGSSDGSAKPTTRLWATEAWVAKTRIDLACPTETAARDWLERARERGMATDVWHPSKVWLAVACAGAWYPMTLCRRLVSLRAIPQPAARLAAWIDMLDLATRTDALHGAGLDLNPSNFGRDPAGRLYYLDEELNERLAARDVAGALAARIPEEPDLPEAEWVAWGARLRRSVTLTAAQWAEILDELRAYPLPERYESRCTALRTGVSAPREPRRELVCVLADIHANLAALESVLADARAHGATRFLVLGDVVGYGPDPSACVQRIADLRDAIAIRGNHDHAIARGDFDVGMNSLARRCAAWTREQLAPAALAWLGALPVEHAAPGWLAVHGAPRDPHRFLAYVYELTYDDNLESMRRRALHLCFYGHTHVQLVHAGRAGEVAKLAGCRELELDDHATWLVNPGSVGQPRDGDRRAAYGLWDPVDRRYASLRVAYDVERTLRGISAAALPLQLEDRLRAGT